MSVLDAGLPFFGVQQLLAASEFLSKNGVRLALAAPTNLTDQADGPDDVVTGRAPPSRSCSSATPMSPPCHRDCGKREIPADGAQDVGIIPVSVSVDAHDTLAQVISKTAEAARQARAAEPEGQTPV